MFRLFPVFLLVGLSLTFLVLGDATFWSSSSPVRLYPKGYLQMTMSSRDPMSPRGRGPSRWGNSGYGRGSGNERRRGKTTKLGYIPPPPIDPLGEGKHKSGLESLYSQEFDQEKVDAWRKKVLVVGARRVPNKSDTEKDLESLAVGRWKVVEDSEDRPNPHLFEMTSNKIGGAFNETGSSKPSSEMITDDGHLILEKLHFEEELFFDECGDVQVTKDITGSGCFGVDWKMHNIPKPGLEMPTFNFDPLTLKFRICRKKVAVDFDECPDINYQPGMFFYEGVFTDTTFETIEGEIYRNRDLFPDPTKPRETVLAGKFKMTKLKSEYKRL